MAFSFSNPDEYDWMKAFESPSKPEEKKDQATEIETTPKKRRRSGDNLLGQLAKKRRVSRSPDSLDDGLDSRDRTQPPSPYKKPSSLIVLDPPTPHKGGSELNEKIIDVLIWLYKIHKSNQSKFDPGREFKFKQLSTAINSVRAYPRQLKSGKEAKKLPGIGPGTATKIQEIIDTGELQELNRLFADPRTKAKVELTRIKFVGKATAEKLMRRGIMSIEDMRQNVHLLDEKPKSGLKYYEDLKQRIPRKEVQEIVNKVLSVARKVNPKIFGEACGSYRRESPDSGDVDLLLTHPTASEDEIEAMFWKMLKGLDEVEGFVKETWHKGRQQFGGEQRYDDIACQVANLIVKLPGRQGGPARQLDIYFYEHKHLYPALVHLTGSAKLNVHIRKHANKLGYFLTDKGLFHYDRKGGKGDDRKGARIDIEFGSEKDVFESVGIAYIEPKNREWGKYYGFYN